MYQPALNDDETELLGELLFKYGNEDDDCLLTVAELDGFLTAIVSSPMLIQPSQWLSRIWANQEPQWKNEHEFERYMALIFRFYNAVIARLRLGEEHYFAMFEIRRLKRTDFYILDEWCIGYMAGVELGGWQTLPEELQPYLAAIAYHADLNNPPPASAKKSREAALEIESSALKIYQYNKAHFKTF